MTREAYRLSPTVRIVWERSQGSTAVELVSGTAVPLTPGEAAALVRSEFGSVPGLERLVSAGVVVPAGEHADTGWAEEAAPRWSARGWPESFDHYLATIAPGPAEQLDERAFEPLRKLGLGSAAELESAHGNVRRDEPCDDLDLAGALRFALPRAPESPLVCALARLECEETVLVWDDAMRAPRALGTRRPERLTDALYGLRRAGFTFGYVVVLGTCHCRSVRDGASASNTAALAAGQVYARLQLFCGQRGRRTFGHHGMNDDQVANILAPTGHAIVPLFSIAVA